MTNTTSSAASLTEEVLLSRREVKTLIRLADYYLTIRPLRPLVLIAAPGAVRRRYRYIAQESKWLKRFAKAVRDDIKGQAADEVTVKMSLPALVAFWGRLLASLQTPRSRRKLSIAEFEVRERLTVKFGDALSRLDCQHRRSIEEQLRTRRPSEEIWMRQRLGLPHGPGQPDASQPVGGDDR